MSRECASMLKAAAIGTRAPEIRIGDVSGGLKSVVRPSTTVMMRRKALAGGRSPMGIGRQRSRLGSIIGLGLMGGGAVSAAYPWIRDWMSKNK